MSTTTSSKTIAALQAQINSLKKRCERAELTEKNLRTALRHSHMALCHHDKELRYTWLYNGHMGFDEKDVLGKTDWDILEQDLADRMGVIKRRVLETGKGERVEMPTVVGDPHCEYFDLSVDPLFDDETGEIIGLVCSGIDVTEDRRLRETYRTSEENLRFIFNASPMPITVTDIATGLPLFYNAAADQLFSINKRMANGLVRNLFAQFNLPEQIQYSLSEGKQVHRQRFKFHKNHKLHYLSFDAKQIFFNDKAAILATFTDLTLQTEQQLKLEKARRKAEKLAHTDVMTGLHNRRSLFYQGEKILHQQKRASDNLCAVIMDIDFFKSINDSWGHYIGDKAIELVGKLIQSSIRETDVAARYGGEEFAILLPHTDLDQANAFAEKLRIETSNLEMETEEGTYSFTASFGVAEFSAEFTSIGDLLKSADVALYAAKHAGRNQVKCAD